jgi:hypothetical protein
VQVGRRQSEDIGEISHEDVQMIRTPNHHLQSVLEIAAIFFIELVRVVQTRMKQRIGRPDGVVHFV